MADTNGKTQANLIELALEDHRAAEALLDQIGTDGCDQSSLFDEIVHNLIGHETAEEEVVYPAVRSSVAGGVELADVRIAEQKKAAGLLAEMETMDRDSSEFAASLSKLRDEALAHAKSEESEVFPKLRDALSSDQLVQLGAAFQAAKQHAPSHPAA